ncbi:MAG: IS1595 family transposase [Patescibacteria group bacterium]|nr:IS1595 family transposase [Patescibacteria group bacterium]MDD5295205.1 IS1595 family transposase [Patescibacteria group bacterium]MDD5554304.1 IS1595 family transposase [Patescibacteria group bacterium]
MEYLDYAIKDFNKEYTDEDACLDEIFQQRFGNLKVCPRCGKKTKFHKVSNRKCYACQYCSYQLHPLAGTIFNKSSTPLKLWFLAIFLMSHKKNGVSAKELQRHLGVTYKTAWRMAKEIKHLMV